MILGSYNQGEANGKATAPDSIVDQVRADYVPGRFGLRKLAKKYALPQTTVWGWINNTRRINFAALRK